MTPTRVIHERQRVFALDTNIFIYHFEENPSYVGFTEALFERIGTFPNLHLVPFEARIAEISADLRARYDLPTPDAIQVATALQQGAETFVTNDARLKRVREIKVTPPRKAC